MQLPPTSTLVVEYASKDVVQLKARFSEPVDVFKPECIAASIGYSKPNWGQLAGTPTKAEDGKVRPRAANCAGAVCQIVRRPPFEEDGRDNSTLD